MKITPLKTFLICVGLILSLAILSYAAEESGDSDIPNGTSNKKRAIVIGRVSDNPKKHYKGLKSIVDYTVSKLQDYGISEGAVLICKNNQQIIQYLNEGKIDWVTESLFSAILFANKTNSEIVLRRWKEGTPDYYSIFFVRKDSGINSLNDLKGKKIAFEDHGSTTSYFLPKLILMNAGYNLVELSTSEVELSKDKVGYLFAGSELNISAWVHKELADVGVFSNLDWKDLDETPHAYKDDLRIIHKSKAIPRAVELISNKLDPKLKERIKDILLNAHNDPDAKEALKDYNKTAKFDEITGDLYTALEEIKMLIMDHMPDELQ